MSTLALQTATVDLTFLTVKSRGVTRRLTEMEGALLRFLAANPQRDLTREELLAALGREGTPRSVDITVARLRAKLGEPRRPNHLRTVRGVGYRFVIEEPKAATPLLRARPVRAPLWVETGRIDLDRRLFLPERGDPAPLGKLDAELLERLADGAAVPRERLIREIWGVGKHQRSLTAALRRLRERLGDDPHRPRIVISLPGSALRLELQGNRWETRTNLPPQETSFVERPEVGALLSLCSRGATGGPGASPVTVRGPAGIGKTRLVMEVGRRLLGRDATLEVWFCDLSCALAEQGILRAIETALGVQGPACDAADRIVRVLSRKPPGTVLILDNFDQVTHHAHVLEDWMQRAPGVRLLATSRHALGLPGETLLEVEPLSVEAAARLFVDRAPGQHGLDPDSAAVQTLVQRLDCLPLSIELAAARAADATPEALLGRLSDRLSWLVRPPAGSPSPHRSLRGALDWSWDLLDEYARVALAECAIFAGPFTSGLADDVLSVSRASEALVYLEKRSLLQRWGQGFRMLEGIREYAREKAILLGRWEETARRHASVCIQRANAAGERLAGPTLLAALAELRSLRGELLAIRTSAPDRCQRIEAAVALCPLLKTDGPRELALAVCDDALALDPAPEHAWRLLLARGEISRLSGRLEQAESELGRALAAAQRQGGTAPSIVAARLAHTLLDRGRVDEALEMLQQAAEQFRRAGDKGREAAVLRSRAQAWQLRGEHDLALAQLEEVERMVSETKDPLRMYYVHRDLQQLYSERGDLVRAEASIERGLQQARELGLRRAELEALRCVAQIARRRGDYPRAAALLEEAARGYDANGDDGLARWMRRMRALVCIEAGQLQEAERILVEMCRSPERAELRVIDHGNLAIVWHLQGRVEAALQSLRRLCEERSRDPLLQCGLLAHLAAAMADLDQVDAARQTLEQARALCPPAARALLGLLGQVVALAEARAGQGSLPHALQSAASALREVTASGRGEGAVQRDQDLNFARLLLERALALTADSGALAGGSRCESPMTIAAPSA